MTAYPVADTVTITGAQAASRSSVAASLSDTLLLNANAARTGAVIYNDCVTAVLMIGLGSAPTSASDFSYHLGPGGVLELPEKFTGQVRGIWTGTDGSARITELL